MRGGTAAFREMVSDMLPHRQIALTKTFVDERPRPSPPHSPASGCARSSTPRPSAATSTTGTKRRESAGATSCAIDGALETRVDTMWIARDLGYRSGRPIRAIRVQSGTPHGR